MEYTVHQLAQLAGVSVRTLHYYDSIGLLKPSTTRENGYRVYTRREVDLLQQILFYRELNMPLGNIKEILYNKDFDIPQALQQHCASLQQQCERLQGLLATARASLAAAKGEKEMTDKEKFAGFKEELVRKNEETYGKEAREKYGDAAVDAANAKMMGMSHEKYAAFMALQEELHEKLRSATLAGNPESEEAKEVCRLHKEWLLYNWNTYSPEAHLGLCQMYVADERFLAHYDAICPGSAQFLLKAVEYWKI